MQTADDIMILQDGVSVRDVIVPEEAFGETFYRYYEGITVEMMPELANAEGAIHFYFSWGEGRGAAQVFDTIVRYHTGKLANIFLHPVLERGGKVRHVMEDLEMAFRDSYENALRIAIREGLSGNTAHWDERKKFPYVRGRLNLTSASPTYETAHLRVNLLKNVTNALMEAVLGHQSEPMLQKLREAMQNWMPKLFENEPKE
jgi:hypothetical protein